MDMAHFAKLSLDNEVLSVHVVNNSDCLNENGIEDENTGIQYLKKIHGWSKWKKTSYNTRENKYYNPDSTLALDQSKAFRGNYAGTDKIYDEVNDIFIIKKPFPSWILDLNNASWKPPIEKPVTYTDGVSDAYSWDEINQIWNKIN